MGPSLRTFYQSDDWSCTMHIWHIYCWRSGTLNSLIVSFSRPRSISLASNWLLVLDMIHMDPINNSKVARMSRRCVILSNILEPCHFLLLYWREPTNQPGQLPALEVGKRFFLSPTTKNVEDSCDIRLVEEYQFCFLFTTFHSPSHSGKVSCKNFFLSGISQITELLYLTGRLILDCFKSQNQTSDRK